MGLIYNNNMYLLFFHYTNLFNNCFVLNNYINNTNNLISFRTFQDY